MVVFIRHASAKPAGAGGDEARRLTEEGRKESHTAARALQALGLKLQRVLASPLVRATETAGILAEVHAAAGPEEAGFLAPPGDAGRLRRRLAELDREGVGVVGLVGHAPSIDELLAALAAGARDIGASLTKAGAACVGLPAPGTGDPPELRWLMRRSQLGRIAEADGAREHA